MSKIIGKFMARFMLNVWEVGPNQWNDRWTVVIKSLIQVVVVVVVVKSTVLVISLIMLQSCSSSKGLVDASKGTCDSSSQNLAPSNTTVFFDSSVLPVLTRHCTACHSNYSKYEYVSKIGMEIIKRIELNPGQNGVMPPGTQRLDTAELKTLKQWEQSGFVKSSEKPVTNSKASEVECS